MVVAVGIVIAVEGLVGGRFDDDEVDAGGRNLLPPLGRQAGVGDEEINVRLLRPNFELSATTNTCPAALSIACSVSASSKWAL